MLNGSVEVIKTDIKATNGVIHVLNGVLLPSGDESEADGM
ncbi:MAG: fasciclin domain-containing protein [Planctomycetota bacterium]